MDSATIIMIILVLVSLAAGLVTFGVLRERGRSSLVAGCGAIVIGLIIVSCFVLFQIVRILT
ncbi:MAG TPA: hypothetical protein VFV93_06805 [Thermomicrobiales bacterium]|nr:hypothetical protein [Thermomicrobiales bacterium]